MTDFKQAIIDNLKAMKLIEVRNKQPFKARAYDKVIKQIEVFQGPISSTDDVANIKGIGDGIQKKLDEIIQSGRLGAAAEAINNVENEKLAENFAKIMAVGMVKARELVNKHGITSIEQLRERQDLLNDKQKLGLKFHEDFLKRIPRAEMDKHKQFIADVIPSGVSFEIVGSYRRGAPDSGDIDVLLTYEGDRTNLTEVFQSIINQLKRKRYLHGEFGFGAEKFLGIAKLPRYRSYRRIDIMLIPRDKFAFALLYFTGSQSFNIKMRNKALELGYSLSEHGLKLIKGYQEGYFLPFNLTTEAEVFQFLGMPFLEPFKR